MHLAKALLIVLFFGVVAGCSTNRVPRYNVPEPGTIETFKRQTLHDNRDYLFTWKQQAYSQITEPIRNVSEDQQGVLDRHGEPDYKRVGWKSTSNELVDEWIYWDRKVVVQFVQRQLVYEGPVTDMDEIRVKYGYPRRAWSQTYETGVQRDFWDYAGIFETGGMIVSFSNEELVSQNRY